MNRSKVLGTEQFLPKSILLTKLSLIFLICRVAMGFIAFFVCFALKVNKQIKALQLAVKVRLSSGNVINDLERFVFS